jgi:hypothetical protein
MQPDTARDTLPYPIAAVYADLDDPRAVPSLRREALFFCCYQVMRTVGLTLVGQYLTREVPPNAGYRACQSLNRAIAGLRTPHFADWITLLTTLHRHGGPLVLGFLPEFAAAMEAVKNQRVDIPRALAGGQGWQRLTLLEAFQALRNSTQHAGLKRDEACLEAVQEFRPHLDRLLGLFAFLGAYDLLVLRSGLDDDPCLVQTLRGWRPAPAVPELQEGPGRYFTYYNDGHPHQALGYRTPAEVYRGDGKAEGAATCESGLLHFWS